MSEEKQVPSGDEEAKEVTPENNSAQEAGEEKEAPQSETNDPSSEDSVVPETEATPAAEESTEPEATAEVTSEASESTEEEVAEPAPVADPEPETPPVEEEVGEATPGPEAVTATAEETPETNKETEEAVAESPVEDAPSTAAETPVAEEVQPTEEEIPEPEAIEEAQETPEQKGEEITGTAPVENISEAHEAVVETEVASAEELPVDDQAAPAAEESAHATTDGDKTESEEAPATEEEPKPDQPVAETDETEAAKETEETGDKEEPEEEAEEEIDYSGYSREELAEVVDELSKQENFKRSDAILSKVLPLFKAMARSRRAEALEKFLADGGAEDDFEYRHDEVFNRFDASVRLIRDRRASYYKEREARKEENYKNKLEILDKLRELIDGENATTNLSPIKSLQEEWKAVGPVPAQHNRTLWANYNALLDRFYNNRHILFELKELDRKKNLVKKTELCEKAEALDKLENIKDAIIQLNELHEEYKKIGAVPRDVQESLWQRFKVASDAIYKKRKTYLEGLKGELQENFEKKRALADELKPYLDFDSDRINDWNAKTKEILAIQKRWDALGGLPREHAKEVNKAFWSGFKGFFRRKNAFFKKLEGMRHENLQKKEELVAKALELSESTEWDKTSEALKKLQRQWKDIGPVPEKHRNSVYAQFKEACDTFFNNRRASQDKAEAQFVENQKHKEDLIKEIEKRASTGDGAADELDDIMTRWNAIGFVPRSAIRTVEGNFAKALEAFVKSLDVPEEEREALVMKAELSSLKKGPNSDRRLNKKESDLRRRVQEVEDNIALMNNNLSFFANSKGADKLREEYDQKIAAAEEELVQLKKQLRMVRSM